MIAPHDIYRESHKSKKRGGKIRLRAPEKGGLRDRDGHDLALLVVAASGAHPVGHVRAGALGAGGQLRQDQDTIVGAALPLTTLGRFAFRYTHKLFFKLELV
jgi:hypothetical protein